MEKEKHKLRRKAKQEVLKELKTEYLKTWKDKLKNSKNYIIAGKVNLIQKKKIIKKCNKRKITISTYLNKLIEKDLNGK